MKRIIVAFSILAIGITAMAQVKIQIEGVCPADIDTVYIYNLDKKGVKFPVKTQNGKFKFVGEEALHAIGGVGTNDYFIPFFVDGTPIAADLVKHKLKGSALNELVCKTDNRLDSVNNVLRSQIMGLSMKAATVPREELQKQAMELMEKGTQKKKSILEEVKGTLVPAIFLPDMCMDMSLDELSIFMTEDAPYYNLPRMEKVKRYMTGLEKKRPGRMYVDLTMDDMDGKQRQLSEWCAKGNYVLVDFWASWCGPCRQEMPNVVETYVKYHSKGYEIVGVSFDNKAEPWKAAVKTLGMTWPQISDLKGWECAASDAYGIMAIPSNVLLDPDGRIVASDLRGEALQAKLKEIYGF